jgi:multidrug resistance protein
MSQRRGAGLIFAIIFFDLLAFGIVIPQLGIYARVFGASALTQGLLVSSYSAAQFLFAPVLGRWSDRIGRRPVLLVSLLTSLLGHLAFAFAHSLPLLFASRLIDGLGGANVATAQAYLSDVTPVERRSRAMAHIGMAFGLGFILGPALGAFLGPFGSRHLGPHGGNLAIGLLAAACSLVTLVLTATRLPESLAPADRHPSQAPLRLIDPRGLRQAFGDRALRNVLVVSMVSVAGFAVLHAILTYFVIDLLHLGLAGAPAQQALAQAKTGEVFAWIGLLNFLSQGAVHPLAKRVGEVKLLRLGLALQVLALGLMPLVGSFGLLLLAAMPLAVGSAFCSAVLPALVTIYSPAGRRGEMLGVNSSLGSLSRIGGPLSGGLLYDLNRCLPFWVGAGFCAVALVLAVGLPRPAAG